MTLSPVSVVPPSLLSNFTFGHRVEVVTRMFDYRGTAIDTSASRFWTTEYLGSFREAARARRPLGTYMTDALYAVLDAYHSTIQGGVAAVVGTEKPWVEASLLEWGAAKVTTVEYGTIVSEEPRPHYYHPCRVYGGSACSLEGGRGCRNVRLHLVLLVHRT